VTDTPALAAVPNEDDSLELDVQDLLDAHSKTAAEQISGLLMQNARLEAVIAAQRRQLSKRKG
jgi:hypothetical protein